VDEKKERVKKDEKKTLKTDFQREILECSIWKKYGLAKTVCSSTNRIISSVYGVRFEVTIMSAVVAMSIWVEASNVICNLAWCRDGTKLKESSFKRIQKKCGDRSWGKLLYQYLGIEVHVLFETWKFSREKKTEIVEENLLLAIQFT